MNLATNAIKYNTSEKPGIRISAEGKPGRINICFKDNGIGIPKNERKKIFNKFYQIGRSDNMTAKGSGIGLYLAQSIAKNRRSKNLPSDGFPGSRGQILIVKINHHQSVNA